MIKALSDALKLDILLSFKGKGYNLQDTDDPATMKMSLGTGYTLLASINESWFIEFNDGVETTKHHIESAKIPYTNARDARKLCKEYSDECKRVLAEKRGEPVPEQKEPEPVDLEEKMRILEALENGEIEKPTSRKEDIPGKTLEDMIKEDEAKKAAEEKARLAREENERKLALVEQAQQHAEEAEKQESKAPEPVKQKVEVNKSKPVSIYQLIKEYTGNDVFQLVGNTGAGKSKIALHVAKEARDQGKKVFYIDTEDNLTEKDVAELKGIKYVYMPSIEDVFKLIVLNPFPKYDLVVLDSIGLPVLSLYARMKLNEQGKAMLKMQAIMGFLKEWCHKNQALAFLTNQFESDFNKDSNHRLRPFGDKCQFFSKETWEIQLLKSEPALTSSVVKVFKSRSTGAGAHIMNIWITSAGVEVRA